MPSDNYYYQTTNNFKKLLKQEGAENTLMITIQILLVICMHIWPSKHLEDGASNTEFNGNKKLRIRSTSSD